MATTIEWLKEAPQSLNESDRREYWTSEWQHGYEYFKGSEKVGQVSSDVCAPANLDYHIGYRIVDSNHWK